jgi:hypothetical protein
MNVTFPQFETAEAAPAADLDPVADTNWLADAE